MKRSTWLWVVLAVAVVYWRRGDDGPAPNARVQVGVLPRGFVALSGGRIVELDRDGNKQHDMPLRLDADVRLIGTSFGTVVGWQAGKQVRLGLLDNDGNIEEESAWGKKVVRLCDGAATNERRYGIGWLESDGRMWFVHGNMAAADGPVFEVAAKATWCGIASADEDIALMWRDGKKLLLNFCGAKQCRGYASRVPLPAGANLIGFGCARDACTFATRDGKGVRLHRVNDNGRATGVALDDATPSTVVSVVGAGARAFAVAYVSDAGATIRRMTFDGKLTGVWHFDGETQAPTLSWADGRLLVATQRGAYHVLDMPR